MNETVPNTPEFPQPFHTSGPVTLPTGAPLSETARLVDTFIAPSRTFEDVRRYSSRWWLPFLLSIIVSYTFVFAINHFVGWPQVVENSLKQAPKQQERFADMEPTQAAQARHQMAASYKYFSYAAPAFTLLFAVISVAVLLATLNFGFAGEATFGRLFAVWMYATLPLAIKGLLGAASLYAGMSPEQFNMQNAAGTNLGFYLPSDMNKGVLTLASSLDIFTIWTVILLVIGCAIVAKLKRSTAAIAVVGWWIIIVLASTAGALINS